MGIVFTSVPINAVMAIPADRRHDYRVSALETNGPIRQMIVSPRTGAYLRGLAKSHQLPEKTAVTIAFVVLQVAIGEVPIAKISGLLSSHLKLPNDQAQDLATELERDIFASLSLEIGKQAASKKQVDESSAQTDAKAAGARNVLNLKRNSTPPTPPST